LENRQSQEDWQQQQTVLLQNQCASLVSLFQNQHSASNQLLGNQRGDQQIMLSSHFQAKLEKLRDNHKQLNLLKSRQVQEENQLIQEGQKAKEMLQQQQMAQMEQLSLKVKREEQENLRYKSDKENQLREKQKQQRHLLLENQQKELFEFQKRQQIDLENFREFYRLKLEK